MSNWINVMMTFKKPIALNLSVDQAPFFFTQTEKGNYKHSRNIFSYLWRTSPVKSDFECKITDALIDFHSDYIIVDVLTHGVRVRRGPNLHKTDVNNGTVENVILIANYSVIICENWIFSINSNRDIKIT